MTLLYLFKYYEKHYISKGVFESKFGNLFDEFKRNSESEPSITYYSVFFLRRLLYVLLMIYLKDYPFMQA